MIPANKIKEISDNIHTNYGDSDTLPPTKPLFVILLIIAGLLLLCLFSCNPYKKIATAPTITTKNKDLLSIACERYFPPGEPKFVKGETIRDTLKVTDTVTVIDTFNNLVTKIVTNKVIIDNSRTDTFYLPPNQYLVNQLKNAIEALEKQHNEDLIKIAVLESEKKALELQNRRNKLIKWGGWGVVFGFIALFISRQYLKSKFKF